MNVGPERNVSSLGTNSLSTLAKCSDDNDLDNEGPLFRSNGRHESNDLIFAGQREPKAMADGRLDVSKGLSKPPKDSALGLFGAASLPDLHSSRKQPSKETMSTSLPLVRANVDARVIGGSSVNSVEIFKRLNALGTSSSVPSMPSASSIANDHSIEGPMSSSTQAPHMAQSSQGGESTQASTAAIVASPALNAISLIANTTTTSVLGAAANIVPVSDAEKLRNDFSSQDTRLSYGCSVALELFNGHLMMVGSPDGQVRVQALEKLYKEHVIFTLLDLVDVQSAEPLRYGDSVWLQLSVGPGDVSWEQGGILGAKVRQAPQLKALGLLDDDSIRNNVQAPATVGYPIPVTAYLPKSRDDGDMQVDEVQCRLRNKGAKVLGKWTIRSAVCQRRKQKDNIVYNNDEVYLEQDWFYLGADSDAEVVVLRQLPMAVAGKDSKPGEYVVERRGAWKLRLLDSSSGSAGLSLAQQQMERLLLRAKAQLKQSQRMRAGSIKVYGPRLRGGAGFTAQLRSQMAASTRQTEGRYRERQGNKLTHTDALGLEDFDGRGKNEMNTSEDLSRRESGIVGQVPLAQSVSVDSIHTGRTQMEALLPGPGNDDALVAADPSGLALSCALCRSSSIGYNLCCQFRDAIQLLERERVVENTKGLKRVSLSHGSNVVDSSTATTAWSGLDRNLYAVVSKTWTNVRAMESKARDAGRSHKSSDAKAVITLSPLNDRALQLFKREDAAMVGLIKHKEKEVTSALCSDTQTRSGLSPVASRFRDRFKHIGLFMQIQK